MLWRAFMSSTKRSAFFLSRVFSGMSASCKSRSMGPFFRLSCRCASVYSRRVLESGDRLWSLVTDVSVPSVFPSPAVLALRPSLVWFFCIVVLEVVPYIVGLLRQLWGLLDCIRFALSWFPTSNAILVYLCT